MGLHCQRHDLEPNIRQSFTSFSKNHSQSPLFFWDITHLGVPLMHFSFLLLGFSPLQLHCLVISDIMCCKFWKDSWAITREGASGHYKLVTQQDDFCQSQGWGQRLASETLRHYSRSFRNRNATRGTGLQHRSCGSEIKTQMSEDTGSQLIGSRHSTYNSLEYVTVQMLR